MPTSDILLHIADLDGFSDPDTGQVFATCPINKAAHVDANVLASHDAFQHYSQVNPRQRAKWLLKWQDLISKAREDIAKLSIYDTGRLLVEARGEVDYALNFAC